MKRIFAVVLVMVFGIAVGSASAADRELYNGVTDFTGRSYETFDLGMEGSAETNAIEGSSAGGLRAGDTGLYNGVTDFTGRSYDTFAIHDMAPGDKNMVESSSAGGRRETGPDVDTGRSYDMIPMNPALGR